jgi:DNA polymerase-3 subunit gamma/tau
MPLESNARSKPGTAEHLTMPELTSATRQQSEVDLTNVKNKWAQIVDEVKRKKIALGFLLNEGAPTRINAKTLEVTFRKGNGFHMSSVERGREVIEQVLLQLVGVKLRIHCVPDEKGILGEQKTHDPHIEQKKAFELLLSQSAVAKSIVDKFDAELLE